MARPGDAAPALTRKEQAERTEAALKAAAREVFATRGFLNAKISDITAAAGRASGSFYNHFASKEALLEGMLTDWIATIGEELTEHPGEHDLSDREHLRWHVAAVWSTYRRHRAEIRALYEAALVNEGFANRVARLRHEETAALRGHLVAMRDRGVQLPGDVDLVASAIIAAMNEFSRTWLIDEAPRIPQDDEAVDTMTDFLLYGLRGPRPGS